jgi:hypothetical protein
MIINDYLKKDSKIIYKKDEFFDDFEDIYIKNNIYLDEEKKIFNIIENFNKIIKIKFPYYTKLNIYAFMNSKYIVDTYLQNKNSLIISCVPTFIIPIIINKLCNNIKPVDIQLFYNSNISNENSNQKFLNILKKNKKVIKNINDDYNTELDEIVSKIPTRDTTIRDKDIILGGFYYAKNQSYDNHKQFILILLIALSKLKKGGSCVFYFGIFRVIFNIKYNSFYKLIFGLFDNVKIEKINNFNYLSNYFCLLTFESLNHMITDKELFELINIITNDDIDLIPIKEDNKYYQLVNEFDLLKFEYNNFLINLTSYFNNDPENLAVYYIMFLIKDISNISMFFKENKIPFDNSYLIPFYLNYYQKYINKFFSFNQAIKQVIH